MKTRRRETILAGIALGGIVVHVGGRLVGWGAANVPLYVALALGGAPLVWELLVKAWRREFGSDLLAGIAIVTAVVLEEYLAGTVVVLMLAGGGALEGVAVRHASSVLEALAKRMPAVAHRRREHQVEDVPLSAVAVGDEVVIHPHEICPVDGVVVEGRGRMDESYLTGEPYVMTKTVGSAVYSGAINGESVLTVRATQRAEDSRYARIMRVMRESEQQRPRLRRLGDQLGAWYTPVAVGVAVAAWVWSGEALRFLAVLVVATPCPLLLGIPISVLGAISLAAKRGIIIRDPAALEQARGCETLIFDKTGTLTYGEPHLVEVVVRPGWDRRTVLEYAASLEQYSRHPLARAVMRAAQKEGAKLRPATEISEVPGHGLSGLVEGQRVHIRGREAAGSSELPPMVGGLECVVLVDGQWAALFRFRDEPRAEGTAFVGHLRPRHRVRRVVLLSGDRLSEVEYLARAVGIEEVYAGQSPEQKLELVRRERQRAPVMFVGDGINDAPALTAATVGIALGAQNEITTEAAAVVIMDSSLAKVDEFLHVSRRFRRIALQSAVGGMLLSMVGMGFAFAGLLPPVAGALVQEFIDVLAVSNALRMAWPPSSLTDF